MKESKAMESILDTFRLIYDFFTLKTSNTEYWRKRSEKKDDKRRNELRIIKTRKDD